MNFVVLSDNSIINYKRIPVNQINIKGFFLSLIFFCICSVALSQRTASVSGNWNSTATWGGQSVPVSGTDVTINPNVAVTVTAAAACGNLTINGTLNMTSGSNNLTIANGSTVTVNDSVIFNSTAQILGGANGSNGIMLAISSGATIQTARTGDFTIPGGNASGLNGFGMNSGNKTWTYASGINYIFNGTTAQTTGAALTNIGDLTINNAAGVTLTNAATFTGTLTLTSGTLAASTNLTPGSNSNIISAGGNITGTLQGSNIYDLTFTGNTRTAETISSSGAGLRNVTVTLNASQTLSLGGAMAPSGNISITVGTLNLASSGTLSVIGDLTVGSGTTLITNNNGLTFSGNFVRTGTVTAGSSAITITGTATQNIAGFTTTGGITMSKASGSATFTSNVSAAALDLGASGTLNLGTSLNHTFSGQISGSNAAATLNGGSSTINLTATTPTSGTFTFTAGTGTVNYSGTTQSITAFTYNNLSLSTSGTKTAAGTLTVGSVLTIASGVTLNMGTQVLGGASLTTSGSGTLTTQNTSATPLPSGRTWSFTVNYNATSGGQTLRTGTYSSLVLGNTTGTSSPDGNIAVTSLAITASGATLNMTTHLLTGASLTTSGSGTLTTQNTGSTPVPTGRTWNFPVNYNATTGAQTVVTGTYTTLSLGNTSGTSSANGTINATTLITTAGGTFNLGGNQLSNTTSATGSLGIVRTSRSSSAYPSGLTWGGTVEYFGAGQAIIGGTYSTFINSGSGFCSMQGNVTVQNGLTLTGGTIETVGNTFTIATTNITVTNGAIDASFGTVIFNANGTINLSQSNPLFGGQPIDNLTLNGNTILNLASDHEISTNLTINSGKLGMAPSKVLNLLGTVSMSATNCLKGDSLANLTVLNPAAGTLFFDQLTGPYTNFVKDLTIGRIGNPTDISASLTLGNILKVKGNLSPLKGSINTGGFLTIASDSLGSGRILAITPANFTFNGNVTVERYSKDKNSRRYIFIASPVDGLTVRQAWQDDIFITGPGTGGTSCGAGTGNGGLTDRYNNKGFDATNINTISMYSYDQYLPARWVDILSTDTIVKRGRGYRVLFRGARGVNDANCSAYLQTNVPPAPSEATLNVSGPVVPGNFSVTVSGKTSASAGTFGYTLIGNPYPCEIGFDVFVADPANASINPSYWTFDPNGPDGNVTSYLTYNNNSYAGGYHSGGGNPYPNANIIASGQAFFVQRPRAGDTTVTFKESHKTGQAQRGVFRTASTWNSRIRVNYFKSSGGFIDNILIRFSADPTVTIAESDTWDAATLNAGNFIAGLKGVRSFAIQTRPVNFTNDTVGLRVVSSAAGEYKFTFTEFQDFSEAAQIILLDMFLGTQTDVKANPTYTFDITTNSASQGGNRFKLVFRSLGSVMPLSFLNINAVKKDQGVEVSWKVAFEQNVIKYLIERSDNGRDFTVIGEVASKGNSNTSVDYSYVDTKLFKGTVYYRVKSIEANESKYSAVVKINESVSQSPLVIYPNPVKDKLTIRYNSSNLQGRGTIVIRSLDGKTIMQTTINNGNKVIDVSSLTSGIYFLCLTDNNGQAFIEKLVKQ